jgi:hypothetical protein
MSNGELSQDAKYLGIVLKKIYVCKAYKPKFGQGKSISFEEFQEIYGGDPFYSWFGLDNPLMYAAHKAAGGITSLYRQIGTGCEELFRQIIRDQLELTAEQAKWSYKVKNIKGKERTLSLDGRIEIEDLSSSEHKERVKGWMNEVASYMQMDRKIARALKGAVFEIRQGYKSKDSKRQNADIGNAGTAYTHGYLPVVSVLSTQIDSDVAERYINSGWLLLRGHLSESPVTSTYAFCKQVLGYDLASFLERNSAELKQAVKEVLEALLSPSDQIKATATATASVELEAKDELELADELESDAENES